MPHPSPSPSISGWRGRPGSLGGNTLNIPSALVPRLVRLFRAVDALGSHGQPQSCSGDNTSPQRMLLALFRGLSFVIYEWVEEGLNELLPWSVGQGPAQNGQLVGDLCPCHGRSYSQLSLAHYQKPLNGQIHPPNLSSNPCGSGNLNWWEHSFIFSRCSLAQTQPLNKPGLSVSNCRVSSP